jgi:hypothetical protein
VRRGGERGSILELVKFAYELKNKLLHIFVWKRRQGPERPAEKGSERQEPRGLSEKG